MDTVDIHAVESKLSDVTVTAIPITRPSQPIMNHSSHREFQVQTNVHTTSTPLSSNSPQTGVSKYAQLLSVIEEMGKEVRPTYAGSRSSAERLKRSIISARLLVRECLIETERSARQ